MEKQKQNKIKIIIIILATLLTLSVLALVGRLVYNNLQVNTNTTVVVPDNLITPDEDSSDENNEPSNSTSEKESISSDDISESDRVYAPTQSTEATKKAATISLYNKQAEDNIAFAVGNMFPGDQETKYYGVQISYHDEVTVHFKADIRVGYEKLAEVMKVKIMLLNTNEIMYDGLMKEMPDSIAHKLTSDESTTDEMYYEITTYLDTSVGNEYQNKDLVADFKWWVEETSNLDKAPQTNDPFNIAMWSTMAIASAFALIVLLVYRRKEEDKQNG